MNYASRIATAAASAAAIALAAGLLAVPAATGQDRSDLAARCSALAGASLPGDVAIETAQIVDAGPLAAGPPGSPAADLPLHCLVEGTVNRRTGAGGKEYGIGFELRRPLRGTAASCCRAGAGSMAPGAPPSVPSHRVTVPRSPAASPSPATIAATRARCSTPASWPTSAPRSTLPRPPFCAPL